MCFIVEDGGIALDRFRGKHLSSDPAMLSPVEKTSASCFVELLVMTNQVSLYGVDVMPRPRSIVWLFMKYCLRLEKIAPFETSRSLAIRASEITTTSWLPIQTENSGP